MKSPRSKIFVFVVFTIILASTLAFVFSSNAGTLSPSIFPNTLAGLPMYEIFEEAQAEFSYPEIKEAYLVDYLANDWSEEIVVLFWRFGNETDAQKINGRVIEDVKADYNAMFDKVDWDSLQTVNVKGYQAKGITYRAYAGTDYLDGGIMSVAVKEYVIVISMMKASGKPSITEMKGIMEILVDRVPSGKPPSPPPPSEIEIDFPQSLNGIPLGEVNDLGSDEKTKKGFSAEYKSEETLIQVLFFQMVNKEAAYGLEQDLVSEIDNYYSQIFDSVDWGDPQPIGVSGYYATSINLKISAQGKSIDIGIIYVTVGDYLIFVQMIYKEGKPSLSELTSTLEILIGLISDGSGQEPPTEPPPSEPSTGAECRNNNCEYWEGENCKNCVYDCRPPGFCCFPGYSYIYADDYHNGIYDIRDNLAGIVPKGAIILPKGTKEGDFPLAVTSVCDGEGMKTGECVYNYDCPSGICTVEYWCINLKSEEFQEVKDEKIVEEIYKDQNSYKEEYVDAYYALEGSTTQMRVRQAKLDVKLEVQGNTSGRIPEVNEGEPVEVRLEITNGSDYQLALTAGIFYPEDFDLEEKKYTISFEWSGGIASLIGSFKTKLINAKFIVMPPGSKLYVYSKVIPEETGYLDVQGLIYYTTEKKYQKNDPGFLADAPKNYQESEVSESILVKEKPCNWWPICM